MPEIKPFVAKHKKGLTFFSLILVSLTFIVLTNRNLEKAPKEIGQTLIYVFQIGFSKTISLFRNTWNSINELKEVKQELQTVTKKLIEYEKIAQDVLELKQENEQLRRLLQFHQNSPYQQVPAEVIGRDPENLFSGIMVGKGRRHGVRRNMTVIAYQQGRKGLVGKVTYVAARSAMVTPLYDPSSYVSVRLLETRYEGLVNGRDQRSPLLMEYVKKTAQEEIKYGDLVATSGSGGVFPKGIQVGRVRSFRAKSYETSMTIELDPVVDFSKLEYVFIIIMDEESWD